MGTGSRTSEKIPSLDGLRAISILIVFFSHVAPATGRFEFGHGLGVTIPGAFGVTVFFFLSGFLITTLLRKEYDRAERLSFKGFYLRRVLRIFPPLYIMLAGLWLLCRASMIDYDFTLSKVLAASLQVGNYWMIAHGIDAFPPGGGVIWSLAVEEHFYLIFPLLYFVLRRAGLKPLHQATVLWSMCGVFLIWRLLLVFVFHPRPDHLLFSTDTRFDSILFGCALAIWGNPALDATRFSRRAWTWLLFPAGLVGLAVSHVVPKPASEALKYTVEGVALAPIFCAAVRYPDWGVLKLLNMRPAVMLGVLSYSFYLIHGIILKLLERYLPRGGFGLLTVGFAVSFLVSWFMYVTVEKPSNHLRHRLPSAKPASRVPAQAPPVEAA